jgi:hypothetical protein
MQKAHDTFRDLAAGTPWWFTLSGRALPAGILVQFLLAGQAQFRDSKFWGAHGALGGSVSKAALILLVGSLIVPRLRGFGWWTGLVFTLYLGQVVLAAGAAPIGLSLHPFNAGLLLIASLVLLAKIERRRGHPSALANAE